MRRASDRRRRPVPGLPNAKKPLTRFPVLLLLGFVFIVLCLCPVVSTRKHETFFRFPRKARRADGLAYEAQKVGEGTAAAYQAQTQVLGANSIVAIKVIEEIARGNIKIAPEVQVSSGAGESGSGNFFNAFIATLLKEKTVKSN